MSAQNSDFYNRLFELNNWQIQQQKKLRAFQEAQKKLLDPEHQTLLSSLAISNNGKQYNRSEKGVRDEESSYLRKKNWLEGELFQNMKTSDISPDYEEFKLTEPKHLQLNVHNQTTFANNMQIDCENEFEGENILENNNQRPRSYLRKGDGLARFRMTLDDFKVPPKIYKDKNIKTHLPSRQKSTGQNINSKKVKHVRSKSGPPKVPPNVQKKITPFPVNIYVPEPKIKKQPPPTCGNQKQIGLKLDVKSDRGKKTSQVLQNTEKLPLKNFNSYAEECNLKNVPDTETGTGVKEIPFIVKDYEVESCNEGEIERKHDENELKIFEMLEQKVDESSFCSNSSYVDRLMEIRSPPKIEKTAEKRYAKGLQSLRAQFLNEQQIQRFGKLDELCSSESSDSSDEDCESEKILRPQLQDEIETGKDNIEQNTETTDEVGEEDEESKTSKKESEATKSRIASKTLLQEYVKNFKNLKLNCKETFAENKDTESSPEKSNKADEQKATQSEIALKLKRKGLQDNVKQLMNWECPTRKKTVKRLVKKIKPKPGKLEKAKSSTTNDTSSKTVFNSSLLKERLDELEKEISIFRKENSKIEKLQKECEEERLKLNKERKEFEKYVEEEKQKIETQLAEGNKKLQKEKAVFEKYCKQVKNQPTRSEREEISQLKKEIQKLTESLATKESRWGAAQARLRNQVRQLEKENLKLQAENEKLQKMCSKKVTFGNHPNIESKIIRAINSELGKLKPALMKSGPTNHSVKRQPLSARINRNVVEKPLRRINSAPNMKRADAHEVYEEASSEWDDKPLASISTDSGIEATLSRSAIQPAASKTKKGNSLVYNENACSKLLEEEPDLSGEECCDSVRCISGQKSYGSTDDDIVPAVVRETIFGKKDFDQPELNLAKTTKSLEELHCKKYSKDKAEAYSYISKCNSDEEKESFDSIVEIDKHVEDKENESEVSEFYGSKEIQNRETPYFSYNSSYGVESRIGENNIRERIFEDGSKEMYYPNGNVKKIFPGNKIIKIIYYNGDIKETNLEVGSEKYYYSETKTWHTTYKDGLEVLEFSNGQTERRHPNGITEISFPNGCVRYCDASGRDEWRFPDNTVIKTDEKGHKILLMPNGQKEIHTKEFKQREYPDGTVKILYADGTQETRYASGRVRLKDKAGNLIMDSGGL